MDEEIRIIDTGDGSQSLYNPFLRETYHSTHGALTESQHVFIQMGLAYLLEKEVKELSVLEVGLGTGLNALLSVLYAREHSQISLDYHTLEPFPLSDRIISELKYPAMLNYDHALKDFELIHTVAWGETTHFTDNFSFTRYIKKVENLDLDNEFNMVFYDAFAPSKQAEVWEKSVFGTVYDHMSDNGVLVTYCAKGQFKRDLSDLGFFVETLDGPPGKKEMVRATKLPLV